MADTRTAFAGGSRIEGVHPLQLGVVRRKDRTQRRSGLPIENPLVFYPRRVVEQARTKGRWLRLAYTYRSILKRVLADADRAGYSDEALRVAPREDETLPDFVQAFADKILQIHGAPFRNAAAVN